MQFPGKTEFGKDIPQNDTLKTGGQNWFLAIHLVALVIIAGFRAARSVLSAAQDLLDAEPGAAGAPIQ